MDTKTLDKVAYALVLLGGLNWGWIALFEKDLVGELFNYGDGARVVYGVIGVAAVYLTYWLVVRMNKKR